VRFSRFISGQRRQQTHNLGALVVAGGAIREGEHKRQYGRVELFCRGVGSAIVSVQATPVYTSASTTEDFTSNTLSVTSVSTGYEYALTNGNDYTISSSSNFLSTSYHAYYPYNAYRRHNQ
jgi:hypothetical protein